MIDGDKGNMGIKGEKGQNGIAQFVRQDLKTTTGSFTSTVPSEAFYALVSLVGGGGGGGAGFNISGAIHGGGGGGGAGAVVLFPVPVSSGTQFTGTVAGGGAAAASGSTTTLTYGTLSFTATGGTAGSSCSNIRRYWEDQ